jgi:hypothetical protein
MQADRLNHLVRRIDVSSSTVITLAGTAASAGSTNGVGVAAKFNNPVGTAMDSAGTFALIVRWGKGVDQGLEGGLEVLRSRNPEMTLHSKPYILWVR